MEMIRQRAVTTSILRVVAPQNRFMPAGKPFYPVTCRPHPGDPRGWYDTGGAVPERDAFVHMC
jgi:hypothetical protein